MVEDSDIVDDMVSLDVSFFSPSEAFVDGCDLGPAVFATGDKSIFLSPITGVGILSVRVLPLLWTVGIGPVVASNVLVLPLLRTVALFVLYGDHGGNFVVGDFETGILLSSIVPLSCIPTDFGVPSA